MNATRKQIDLAIRLGIRTGKIKPFEDKTAWQAMLATKTAAEVDGIIKAMNAKLGFEPQFTAASNAQLAYIAHLEHDTLGAVETTASSRLTYKEADARIQLLKASQAPAVGTQKRASSNVTDIFTKKAV